MLNSFPTDRYLQGFNKADYSSYRVKRDRKVIMSSLLDYAKAEKVLKDSEETHTRLVNNLNLIYSGNSELSQFLRLLRSKKKNVTYKENSSPPIKVDSPKVSFKREIGGKRKLYSKVDKDHFLTRDLITNCSGKTHKSSKMVLMKSNLKAEDEVTDYNTKEVCISSFPKVVDHPSQMDPDIRIPKQFDKQENNNFDAYEKIKNKQSRRMHVEYQVDDIQKLVRGASGRLIPLLGPSKICSSGEKSRFGQIETN